MWDMLIGLVVGSKQKQQNQNSPIHYSNHQQQTASRSISPNLAMAASSIASAAIAAASARAPFAPSMVDPALLADDSSREQQLEASQMGGSMSGQMASPMGGRMASPIGGQMGGQMGSQMGNQMSQMGGQELKDMHSNMFENSFGPSHEQHDWEMIGNDGNMFQEQPIDHNMGSTSNTMAGPFPVPVPRPTPPAPLTTEFTTEYGNGQRSIKPKVRARFEGPRRKEVQAVRKIGACIRCRVLRKTCSLGTPCDQCKKVESARVWKHPCSRTKIADEFLMYSAGLHQVLATAEVSAIKEQAQMRNSHHQIEASHFPETAIFANLLGLEGQVTPSEGNLDPGLTGDFSTTTLRVLDADGDDLPAKLESYVRKMGNIFIQEEPSQFMSITLNTAAITAAQHSESLMTRVLELWSIVHILIDHELKWNLNERAGDDQMGQGPLIKQSNDDKSYDVICLQLGAAAERKAAVLCKNLLSDLERQMCDRAKQGAPSHFELYLITMVLLNCVEKSAWVFRCWEQEDFVNRWPLENPPVWYANEGDKVTDHFHYLMKMRNILPEVTVDPNGILTAEAFEGSQDAVEYFKELHLSRK